MEDLMREMQRTQQEAARNQQRSARGSSSSGSSSSSTRSNRGSLVSESRSMAQSSNGNLVIRVERRWADGSVEITEEETGITAEQQVICFMLLQVLKSNACAL
jgi:uncharacterized FlaG/YvyC family protein